jgi:GrpB-like predicted nucleotidyltransferase (UPF0157 family)
MTIHSVNVEPIELHQYDPEWTGEFSRIGTAIRHALGSTALRIDHIGSTAVSGLAAKPIIDVQVSVVALEPVSAYRTALTSLGYHWREENPDLTKRYFRETSGQRRTHIHVRKYGSWHEQFALLFRDYLRLHAADRDAYESAKRVLAQRFRIERQKYTDAKEPILWEIMQRAHRWAALTGWEPGALDA